MVRPLSFLFLFYLVFVFVVVLSIDLVKWKRFDWMGSISFCPFNWVFEGVICGPD